MLKKVMCVNLDDEKLQCIKKRATKEKKKRMIILVIMKKDS